MLKKIIIGVSLVTAVSTIAVAQEAITTGSVKGNYYRVGHKFNNMMGKEMIVDTSKGSVENLDRLAKGTHQFGIVQMDAYAWYMGKHPESEQSIEPLGPLYEECVFVAVNKNGPIQEEDDLEEEYAHIAVGARGSGTAVTWDYVRQLDTGFKKAKVSFTGGMRALGKLAMSVSKDGSEPNAVMWTIKPRMDGKMIQAVLKNKNLKFIALNDSSLNNKYKPIGRPIYHFKNVDVKKGWGGSFQTICTDAAMMASNSASEESIERAADLVMNYGNSLQ